MDILQWLSENIEEIVVTVIIIPLSRALYKKIKFLRSIKKWRDEEIKEKLDTNFGKWYDLVNKNKLFIQIYGQTDPTHNTYVVKRSHKAFLLTKKFVNEYLSSKVTGKKRYMILAGSGMGKTTFSADLVFQYINKYNQKNIPFPISILYLGDCGVIKKIEDLSKEHNACRSILILDALDENINAIKDPNSFIKDLNKITNIFKFVIITCRTQFFPSDFEIPDVIDIQQNGHPLTWERIYVSPFSEEEIRTYLDKKFKIGSREYQKAISINNGSSDLMSRPMLLANIEDLLGFAQPDNLTIVEIYNKIIDEWLKRECERQDGLDNHISKSKLYIYSKKLALYIYNKWVQTGAAHITSNEYSEFKENNGYSGDPYSYEGRSLIDNMSDGSKKFSHKSFWEFFIAIDVLENPGKSYTPENLDMAKKITDQLNELYLQDHKLDNINYFEYNDTRFTKEELENLKNYFESHKQEILQNKDITLLYKLWDKIESYIIDLLIGNVEEKSYLIYKFHVFSLVGDIQKCFYIENINYESLLKTIEMSLKFLINIHIGGKTYSFFPVCKSFKVVFPNLLLYNNQMIDDILSHKLICIGCGFYNNQSIHNLIVNILTRNSNIDVINVIKDCTSIDDAIEFVSELTEMNKNSEIEGLCVIVVSIKINETKFVYVLRPNYTQSQIKTCLCKMYNLKLGIITS